MADDHILWSQCLGWKRLCMQIMMHRMHHTPGGLYRGYRQIQSIDLGSDAQSPYLIPSPQVLGIRAGYCLKREKCQSEASKELQRSSKRAYAMVILPETP